MNFEVVIVGANSAIQAFDRYPTCQVIYSNDQPYLIDCGEGSQFRMEKFKIKRSKINQIFISHLHGDHCFGLIGFISSLNLNSRKDKLTIFGPVGIKEILSISFFYSRTTLKFPLEIIVVDTEKHQKIFEDKNIEVFTIPLDHKVPTTGYLFREKPRPLNMLAEKIREYKIPREQIEEIKRGMDFVQIDGTVILNNELTFQGKSVRSYAFCSDTKYNEKIIPYIHGVNLLYHEATYGEEEAIKAEEYYHSTAKQAAMIANKAVAKKLIIGHFSSRYENLNKLLFEATDVFPSTQLAVEGQYYAIE